jgi:protease I
MVDGLGRERGSNLASKPAAARVAILAEDLYEEIELWYPYYRLKEAGATVTVLGTGRADTFMGKHGVPVVPDASVESRSVDDFDGVVIPGGYAPDLMRRNPAMVEFVRQMGTAGKPVAAICHAGWMLISAGLAKNRRTTCFPSIRDDMIAAGAEYIDEPVVVDRNVITSRSPADLPAFMPPIIEALAAAVGRGEGLNPRTPR